MGTPYMLWHWRLVLCLWLCVTCSSPTSVMTTEMTTDEASADNMTVTIAEQLDLGHPFPLQGHIKHVFSLYLAPVLLFTGTAGNVLSFLVYSQPVFRKSITSFLFRILAVADTVALNYGLWNNWLRYITGRSIIPETDAYCKTFIYLKYVLADFPVWVLVIVSLERVIGVTVPHRARLIVTKLRLTLSILCIFILLLLYNVPMLITLTSKPYNVSGEMVPYCVFDTRYTKLTLDVVPWMDLVMYALMPLVLMLISSVIIIVIVMRRKRQLESTRSRSVDTNALTATLLTVCFVFMLLTLPHAIYALSLRWIYHTHKQVVDFDSWHLIVGFLRYVNNAINFFLYCLSGRPFRKELCRIFCRRRPGLYRDMSSNNSTRMSVISKTSFSR